MQFLTSQFRIFGTLSRLNQFLWFALASASLGSIVALTIASEKHPQSQALAAWLTFVIIQVAVALSLRTSGRAIYPWAIPAMVDGGIFVLVLLKGGSVWQVRENLLPLSLGLGALVLAVLSNKGKCASISRYAEAFGALALFCGYTPQFTLYGCGNTEASTEFIIATGLASLAQVILGIQSYRKSKTFGWGHVACIAAGLVFAAEFYFGSITCILVFWRWGSSVQTGCPQYTLLIRPLNAGFTLSTGRIDHMAPKQWDNYGFTITHTLNVEQEERTYEPKNPSNKPKYGSSERSSDTYGGISRKGYFRLSIYHKMRKRQYGSRWQTQFVPLCREEVKRLEERRMWSNSEDGIKPALEYMEDIELRFGDINRSGRVTL